MVYIHLLPEECQLIPPRWKSEGLVSNDYGDSFCQSIMNKCILFHIIDQSITLIRKQLFWYPKFKKKIPQVIESALLAGSHWDLFIHGLIQFQKKCSFEHEMTHIHWGALECHPGFSYHSEIKNALKCSAAFRLTRGKERREGSWNKVDNVERKGVTTYVSEKKEARTDKLSSRTGSLLGLRLLHPSGWIHFTSYSKRSWLAKWQLRNGQESTKSWILRNEWI